MTSGVAARFKNPRYLAGWGIALLVTGTNWLLVSDLFGWEIATAAMVGVIAFWLSPLGSWMNSHSMGARHANPDEEAYIRGLMQPLLERAGRPQWRPRVWIAMEPVPNAWAFGLSDVLVTEGLMREGSPEELQGVLAHEIAHLVCHHTLISLVARSGMFVASAAMAVLMFFMSLLDAFLSGFFGTEQRDAQGRVVGASGIGALFGWLFKGFVWVINQIFHLILLAIARLYEYEADAKTVEFGAGGGQVSFLRQLHGMEAQINAREGLLAMYTSTHPPTGERIRRLEALLAGE